MNVTEFFQQSAGKWFSQKTSHHPASKPAASGKSDVYIEILANDAPEVIKLCEQYSVDPAIALCGVQSSWNGAMDQDTSKTSGSMILVLIPDADHENEGKLLRQTGSGNGTAAIGRYVMGNDDVLTLMTEDDTLYVEERIWFASPNLRLRTSVSKQAGGFSHSLFHSEIRMGVTKLAGS